MGRCADVCWRPGLPSAKLTSWWESVCFLFVLTRGVRLGSPPSHIVTLSSSGKNPQGLRPGCRELGVGVSHGEPAGGGAGGARGSGDGCMNGLTRLESGRFYPQKVAVGTPPSVRSHSQRKNERAWEKTDGERGESRALGLRESSGSCLAVVIPLMLLWGFSIYLFELFIQRWIGFCCIAG